MNYEIINLDNNKRWNQILSYFNFDLTESSFNYCKVFYLYKNMIPEMFYYESQNSKICYIYLKENIIQNKYNLNYYHISSPYCYGGFLYNKNVDENFFYEFRKKFEDYAIENNIITEFIRFNPITHINRKGLKNHFNLYYKHTETQVLEINNDLNQNEIIRKDYKYKIRKAKSNNLIFKFNDLDNTKHFYKIYNKSMAEKNVKGFYNFKETFFKYFFEYNSEKFYFPTISTSDKEIISAAILLNNSYFVDYFLGASNSKFRHLYPNHYLFSCFMSHIIENHKKIKFIHYGGGTENLVFFKKGFSNKINNYYVAKNILNEKIYLELTNSLSSKELNIKNYFPNLEIK